MEANGSVFNVDYFTDETYGYLFLCSSLEAYGLDLDVLIAGYWMDIPLESLIFATSSTQCALKLFGTYDGQVIFGNNFFQYQYTIFDMENQRMGFVPLVNT